MERLEILTHATMQYDKETLTEVEQAGESNSGRAKVLEL